MSWAPADDQLALTIQQVQSDAPVLTMPIGVTVATASGNTRHTVWNDRKKQTFRIPVSSKAAGIENVSIDPDGWILKHVTYGASP